MLKKTLFFTTLALLIAGTIFLLTKRSSKPAADSSQPVLRMVTEATFPPFEYRKGQRIVGIDPDIIAEIARRNGYRLEIEDMKFNTIIQAVNSGKADIAASGLSITEERKLSVNFTIPYVSAGQVILYRIAKPVNRNDLKNYRIGVQAGTTGATYVAKNINTPAEYENIQLAAADLVAGKLDLIVGDEVPAKIIASRHPGILQIQKEPLTFEEYAFAVSKNRPQLLNMLNKTLQQMKDDGTLDKIFAAHYGIAQQSQDEPQNAPASGFWESLKQNFYQNFIAESRYTYLVNGFMKTIIIAACSVILGILIGFLVAVIRSAADQTGKLKIANFLCKCYLTIIRGTPVVVQLMIIYFVIFSSTDVSKILVAILAFGLNSGAYVAEIIRSGINSVDHGQLEAGRSLGLSYPRTMILIVLPQAFKNILPALGNEFIVLLKETSVAGYIALQDLTKAGDIIRSQTYNAFMPLIAVALIYLAVVIFFTYLLSVVEKRLKKNE